MAKDPKIDTIVSNLLEGTKKFNVKWDIYKSSFNSDTEHNMTTTSSDGLTTFRMTVHVDSTLKMCVPTSSMLIIQNKSLVNGVLYVHQSDCTLLSELEKTLFKNYVLSVVSKISRNNSSLLDDIASSVFTKDQIRDTKLSSLLGDYKPQPIPKNTPVENTTTNTTTKINDTVPSKEYIKPIEEKLYTEIVKEDSWLIKMLKKIGL